MITLDIRKRKWERVLHKTTMELTCFHVYEGECLTGDTDDVILDRALRKALLELGIEVNIQ